MRNRLIFSIKQIAQFRSLPASRSEFDFELRVIGADSGVGPVTEIVVHIQEVNLKEVGLDAVVVFLRFWLIIECVIEEVLEFGQVNLFDVVFSIAVIGFLMFAKQVLSKGFVVSDQVYVVLGETFVSILLKDGRLWEFVLFPLALDKTSGFVNSFVGSIVL